jgi:SOS-response transcriptional repressor LexA
MNDKRQEIRDWLQAELDRKGHGAKGKLAEYLGIRPEGVSRILADKPGKEIREIGADELLKMSQFFGVAPPGLQEQLSDAVVPKGTVKVIGKVAAHTWLDVNDMDFGYDDEEPIPASPEYPAYLQFALIVEGNCLNKIAVPGSRLDCLDIIRAEYEPVDGDLVIVERKRFGGQMVERTAKRLRKTSQGMELWPESNDPAHQDPIPLNEQSEDIEMQIIGKVLWIVSKP